ncbi:MAG: glutathione synthase [Oscillatoriales cyanobacterium]|uniref:Glutathione synthetase n=1 Tax=Microcoleus anatoxicus PTRS2 TaxID=2705321 RepID=A0ABU8YQR4_9CYAN|nr:MAG: glutathione synthase [Oscillatoriales cyanobacterium]TAE01328.1 MAG: glutathione synthase [Oscillatoriales cyanobacterium]TAE02166.1 MAG: glutathione synthase [Oscillatoriales cyanobacterium]TAF07031.1 MAG: glutathione synthase [Oscillatoriales cyanobacterium]TAF32095.1 MAG: glutathione synthase [Oscillatoriales cyanobacterium]
MKFAFIIDPLDRLIPGHDSSVALMEAAQTLGHEVWVTQANELSVIGGKTWGMLSPVTLTPVKLVDGRWVAAEVWYEVEAPTLQPLEAMDAVFMRTDPPVNVPYLYATYLLDYIDPAKTLVVNSPQGLRDANEKMYALQFEGAIPETIVSQSKQVIRQFVEKKGAAVLKPLGGKAGEGILFLEKGDRNLNSLVEISTHQGTVPVMVQTYLPEAKDGDKRIILLNGKPIGAINRIPTGNEFRGNMAVGGRVAKTEISDRELQICSQLAPVLQRDGLYFVGIDIIGGYLTEVNVTSPTGIREIDLFNGVSLGKEVIEWVVSH